MSSRDQKIADKNSGTIATTFQKDRSQIVNITDLLSEGPIEGLVNGNASIKLNKDPIVEGVVGTYKASTKILEAIQGSNQIIIDPYLDDPTSTIDTFARTAIFINIFNVYRNSVTIGTPYVIKEGSLTFVEVPLTSADNSFDSSWMDYSTLTGTPGFRNTYKSRLAAGGESLQGRLDILTTSSAKFRVYGTNSPQALSFVEENADSINLELDWFVIASETADPSIFNLAFPWLPPTGNYSDLGIAGAIPINANGQNGVIAGSKYKSVSTEFRIGTLEQKPVVNFGNTTGVSFAAGPSFTINPLEYWDTKSKEYKDLVAEGGDTSGLTIGQVRPVRYKGTSPTGFGLTYEQASQVDEIRFVFNYSGLFTQGNEDGKMHETGAFYNVKLKIFRGAEETEVNIYGPTNNRLGHKAKIKGQFLQEERIWLEPFKPFSDFELIIERVTRQEGQSVRPDGSDRNHKKSTMVASSAISSINSVIKEPLSYPYSAYANIQFDSSEFSSPPIRTYELRGMKVKVPSNYRTREETGSISAEYSGLWDGSFRPELVYTNNPAWVFYDIVTNNRYGLGDWIKDIDIDKYALYRIGKYCDSLVPDGKGGTEPRYQTNIYLTKAADAYKVLKDIASVFVGLVYWIDGKVTAVADQASDPIYTFTAGNVIEGSFSYTSSGTKARPNQIVVGWNNPEKDYIIEPLIVENRAEIVETNKLLSSYSSAFGATSEGQAQRYGRYKLYTAQYQTEICSFQTSINAAFLRPGDIVQVQDQARNQVSSSGRVKSSSRIAVELDRPILFEEDINYALFGLISTGGAFLAQKEATLDGIDYTRGELIPLKYYGGEETAINIEDDSGDIIDITWSPHTFVEERAIDYEATTGGIPGEYTVMVLDSEFTVPLIPSSVWALSRQNGEGSYSVDSPKLYKILGIVQEASNKYSITALEHFNEKFDSVENNYSVYKENVFDPPMEQAALKVPTPNAVYVSQLSDPNTRKDEFVLAWLPPLGLDGEEYKYLSGYKISHTVPGMPNPIFVDKSISAYPFSGIDEGIYRLGVQTISSLGTSSPLSLLTFEVDDPFSLQISRLQEGIGIGGLATQTTFATADGVAFKFDSSTDVIINPNAAPEVPLVIPNTASLDLTSTGIEDNVTYYVLAKSAGLVDPDAENDTERNASLKLIAYYNSLGSSYWYDVIDTAGTPEDNFAGPLTGTVSIASRSSIIRGTNTTFLTDLAVRNKIRVSNTDGSYVIGTVIAVVTDTFAVIDATSDISFTDRTIYKSSLNFLLEEDTVIASIRRSSLTNSFSTVNFLTTDPVGSKQYQVEVQKVGSPVIEYNTAGTAISSAFSLEIDTSGYDNPIVKVTGDAFQYLDESEDTAGIAGGTTVTRSFTLSDPAYDASTLQFDVEVIDGNDPLNSTKSRAKTYNVTKNHDASSFIRLDDISVTTVAGSGGGSLAYNDANGVFTFAPAASIAEVNDLTAAVTWADVPDANITESSVTQHEAALSITESQISDLTPNLQLGTTSTTALAGDTALLQLGTTSTTALAGDTPILALDSISIGAPAVASSGGSLAYNNSTGVFTFTPADIGSAGVDLTAFSVTTATASSGGSLAYNNSTGVFTFTPADLSSAGGGIELTAFSVQTQAASASGALAYNNSNGVFSFTPPDLSSYLTSETFTSLLQDTTPQLGGLLDLNGNALEDTNCTFSMDDDTTVANRPTITLNSELDIYNVLNNGGTANAGNPANFFIHDGAVTPSFLNWKLKVSHEGDLDTVGDIRGKGNVIAYYTSDQTLKTDITPIQNSLDKVNTLRGVDFNWIDSVIDSKGGEDGYFVRKKDVGVIAQEVKAVIPEAVATKKDGTLGVRYEALIPLLIEAIKELKARVEELENGNITKN